MSEQRETKLRVVTMSQAISAVVKPGSKVHWDRTHGERHLCPVCNENMMRVAVVDVAHTFEVCECRREVTYDHLVEQLWHRTCLAYREGAPTLAAYEEPPGEREGER